MSAYSNTMVHPASLKRAGEWIAEQIKDLQATLLFGTGTSGMSVGCVASVFSDVTYLHLRKEGESSHGCPGEIIYPNIGLLPSDRDLKAEKQRVIIVDDFTSSGTTVERLIDVIRAQSPHWEIVAICLYASGGEGPSYRSTGIPIRCKRITPRTTIHGDVEDTF